MEETIFGSWGPKPILIGIGCILTALILKTKPIQDAQTHYLHRIYFYISDIPPSAYSSRDCGSTNASQSDACVGNRPIL